MQKAQLTNLHRDMIFSGWSGGSWGSEYSFCTPKSRGGGLCCTLARADSSTDTWKQMSESVGNFQKKVKEKNQLCSCNFFLDKHALDKQAI